MSMLVTIPLLNEIVTVIAGVVTGAIGVSVPRLSYYLGKGDKEAYVALVNRGSRIFNFFYHSTEFWTHGFRTKCHPTLR